MSTPTRSPAELSGIDTADDLRVSPLREDGVTVGTPTWIWCVVVDGDLYVRAYYGAASAGTQAARARPGGRIHAAGSVHDVTFEPAADPLADRVDDAYRAKYRRSPTWRPWSASRRGRPASGSFRAAPDGVPAGLPASTKGT